MPGKTGTMNQSTKIHIRTADSAHNVAARPRPDMAAGNLVCFEVCEDAAAPRFCAGDFILCEPDGKGYRVCCTIANETAAARARLFAGLR